MMNQIGSYNKAAYQQHVNGAIARASCPDGGISSFVQFLRTLSKMNSVDTKKIDTGSVTEFVNFVGNFVS